MPVPLSNHPFSVWHFVQGSPPQCLSSHQNTIWWIRRAFSGDSQNTLWHKFASSDIPMEVRRRPAVHTDTRFTVTCTLCHHLIFYVRGPSREWNSLFWHFIFQRFDFRARNNSVWGMKLYCLTPQTILFGSRNNIVPGTFCLFSENKVYSFPK